MGAEAQVNFGAAIVWVDRKRQRTYVFYIVLKS